ncbi:hypothetical protein WN51_08146 [Melipona quadrifasciata]|uniref:Uncharacterized protein n=1 Tax=Melipona quadrifasciata TaxID=166423 RepID=A0A0M8ZNS3_9HYME|nr:hypothetical protein WN51_08146 [Melipona quadrifasciata]
MPSYNLFLLRYPIISHCPFKFLHYNLLSFFQFQHFSQFNTKRTVAASRCWKKFQCYKKLGDFTTLRIYELSNDEGHVLSLKCVRQSPHRNMDEKIPMKEWKNHLKYLLERKEDTLILGFAEREADWEQQGTLQDVLSRKEIIKKLRQLKKSMASVVNELENEA